MRPLAVALFGFAFCLLAATFDIASLYVPGVALILIAVGAFAWVALSAAGAAIEREAGPHTVVEEQPYPVRLEVRMGALPAPGGDLVEPLLPAPVPIGGPLVAPRAHQRPLLAPRPARARARAARAARPAAAGVARAARRGRRGGAGAAARRAGHRARRRRRRRRGARRRRASTPGCWGGVWTPRSRSSRSTGCGRTARAPRPRASTGRPWRAAARCSSAGWWPSSTPPR